MTQSPLPQGDDSSRQEIDDIKTLLLDVVKRQDRDTGKTAGADVEEYLRILRLMRIERNTYETFGNTLSGQIEVYLREIDERVKPALIAVEAASETALTDIRLSKKQADGSKKLMMQVANDANAALDRLENLTKEISDKQDDLRTMQNSMLKRWNEQTQQITTANVEQAAGKAAADAFKAMNQQAIKDEVARQIRALQKQDKG